MLDVRLVLPDAFSASAEYIEDDVLVRALLFSSDCSFSLFAAADVDGQAVDLRADFPAIIGAPTVGTFRYEEPDRDVQAEFRYSGPLPGTNSVENLTVFVEAVTLNVTSVENGSIAGTLQFTGRSGDIRGVADLSFDTTLDTNGC